MVRFIFAAILLTMSYPASAQECTRYSTVAEALSTEYGEVMQAHGVSAGGWVTEIWTNPVSGSWTVVLHGPDGCGQIADGGQGFTLLPVKRGTES